MTEELKKKNPPWKRGLASHSVSHLGIHILFVGSKVFNTEPSKALASRPNVVFFLSSSSFDSFMVDLSGHINHPKIGYCNISKALQPDMKHYFYVSL